MHFVYCCVLQRKYYYNAITLWILDMVDEMAFVQEERRLLEYRARIARNPDDVEEAPAPSKLPGRLVCGNHLVIEASTS